MAGATRARSARVLKRRQDAGVDVDVDANNGEAARKRRKLDRKKRESKDKVKEKTKKGKAKEDGKSKKKKSTTKKAAKSKKSKTKKSARKKKQKEEFFDDEDGLPSDYDPKDFSDGDADEGAYGLTLNRPRTCELILDWNIWNHSQRPHS